MKPRGRPVLAALSGFFLGLFIAIDLLLFGVIPLDSALLTFLPILGLIVVPAVAIFAPIKKRTVPAD